MSKLAQILGEQSSGSRQVSVLVSFLCWSLYKTNRFHVAVILFSNISQKTSMQNVVKTSVTHASAARVPLLCFYHILTSSVTYYWTDLWQHGIYELFCETFLRSSSYAHVTWHQFAANNLNAPVLSKPAPLLIPLFEVISLSDFSPVWAGVWQAGLSSCF